MSKTKKYVLTGGPGVGKSTVIELLAARGYSIIPEAARIIIEEEKIKGSNILPWGDLSKFQELVANRQLVIEDSSRAEEVFLDRSIIDGYAYCLYGKATIPSVITNFAKERYDKVFILEPLPVYQGDKTRWENKEFQEAIHPMIEDAYKYFGYEIIQVPVLPPEERCDFILKKANLL